MKWSFNYLSIVDDFPCGRCIDNCGHVYVLDLFNICHPDLPGHEALPEDNYVEDHPNAIPSCKTKFPEGDDIEYIEKDDEGYLIGLYDGPYKLKKVSQEELKNYSISDNLLETSKSIKEKHQEMWRLVEIRDSIEEFLKEKHELEMIKEYEGTSYVYQPVITIRNRYSDYIRDVIRKRYQELYGDLKYVIVD